MKRFNSFVMTVFIGGIGVVLPIVILAMVFGIIFKFMAGLIDPLTKLLEARYEIRAPWTDLMVVGLILGSAFLIGLVVRTRYGKRLHRFLEQQFLEVTPGYKLIKETTTQLMKGKKSPLSRVALVRPFNNDTAVTAFITAEHNDGTFTIFIPMAPPTGGFMLHMKASQVTPIDVSTEDAMKVYVSLGGGSDKIIDAYQKALKASPTHPVMP